MIAVIKLDLYFCEQRMDKPFLFVWIPRIGHNWVRLVLSLHGLFQVGVSDTIFKLYMHRCFIEDQIRLQDVLRQGYEYELILNFSPSYGVDCLYVHLLMDKKIVITKEKINKQSIQMIKKVMIYKNRTKKKLKTVESLYLISFKFALKNLPSRNRKLKIKLKVVMKLARKQNSKLFAKSR